MTPDSGIFERTLTLKGDNGVFSASLSMRDVNDLKGGSSDDPESVLKAENVEIIVTLRFTREGRLHPIELTSHVKAWSDQIYDLLDLSICMSHFAQIEDMREPLIDNSTYASREAPHKYRAQWGLFQSFFQADFLMFSKQIKRFPDKRFINIIFDSSTDYSHCEIVSLKASPDSISAFAVELRECLESLDDLRDGGALSR